ncbi:putative quinol monooxygenase [Hymenobacter terricola]|uniref:putative quinol monooxygenase n=1 Tax=Hymenobacter terricola TaxID=2819236 RepID=UPI001CF1DCE7|nr:putative quinol monooxygenase [Hymenobacter terricola]
MQKFFLALTLTFASHMAFGQYARHSPLLLRPEALPVVRLTRLPIQAEHREEYLRAANQLAVASRKEAGCVSYHLYEDASAPNTFLVVGEWAGEGALQAHHRQPYTVAYLQQLPQWLAAPTTTTAYETRRRTLTTVAPNAK